MVTIDAARALGLGGVLGSLEVGKRADIAVIQGYGPVPYEALLLADPASVRLVIVDGRELYGDVEAVAAGPSAPALRIRGWSPAPTPTQTRSATVENESEVPPAKRSA